MSLSCIIATSALAADASTNLSSGKRPYAERAWLLRNVILPLYTRWCPDTFREIIVVGEWEPGPGYTYLPFASVYHNCADALLKRQAGFAALRHEPEWVVFQHDDHLWEPANLIDAHEAASVLSPSRMTRAQGLPLRLNDGSDPILRTAGTPALQYLNGHVCAMKPSVFRAGFSWAKLPPVFTWDVEATKKLVALNVEIRYAPELLTWDIEWWASPWR